MKMFIVAVVVVIAFIIIFLALAVNDREESKKDEKQNMIDEFIAYDCADEKADHDTEDKDEEEKGGEE